MAVVIRLQGLPVEAGSADIRHYFSGLKIPDGGVHIIGGKLGEAFIIFVTDEDARRAMSRTGGMIMKAYVQLYLSSKAEMQSTLDVSRKGSRESKHLPSSVESLSKILTAMKKGIHPKEFENDHADSDFHSSGAKSADNNMGGVKKDRREPKEDTSPYVFLFGLPYTASEDDVQYFFEGLRIDEMIFLLRPNGLRDGNALLKFGSVSDANASLKRNNEHMGHRFISVKKSTEQKWIEAGGQAGYTVAHASSTGKGYEGVNKHSLSRSPKIQTARSRSPHHQEFYLHLSDLPTEVRKQDVKHVLGDTGMSDSQIKFLPDKYNDKKMEAFVRIENRRHYEKCLSLHKSRLCGRPISITPISRTAMLEVIDAFERKYPTARDVLPEKDYSRKNLKEYSNVKRSLYVRNFPFDVTKSEVKKFFVGFSVHDDDIILLYDNKNVGLGEALVRFPNKEQAILAEGLNHQRFLGTEVLLRRVSDEQVGELGELNNIPKMHSADYREEYAEPVNSRAHKSHAFDSSADIGNRPYEPSTSSYGQPGFGHGDLRGSRERLSSQYDSDFHGAGEPYGRLGMEKSNLMNYKDPEFIHGSDGGRSSGGLIRMKNVPFTATTEEILDFFYGYNVIPESVFLRISKQGMPSGTATVYIKNYNEAAAAVKELDGRPIGPRKISLTLVKN
uniref:RRM domain-containing protein n=1 Tax=Leptobrachium leishanense TaxID=445787 RepID=A0A8C5Q202_9ANUR